MGNDNGECYCEVSEHVLWARSLTGTPPGKALPRDIGSVWRPYGLSQQEGGAPGMEGVEEARDAAQHLFFFFLLTLPRGYDY